MHIVLFSNQSPFGPFETLGAWTDEEAEEKWEALGKWIEEQQPYGFFRLAYRSEEDLLQNEYSV